MKDTLILYRDWWNVIQALTPEMQLKAFVSICQYAFDDKTPEDPIVSAITALMRSVIDRDSKKWIDIKEKRRIAGRKGGAPKGNINAKKQAKTNKTSKCLNKEEKTSKQDVNNEKSKSCEAKQANACFDPQNDTPKKQPNQAKQANGCFMESTAPQKDTTENKEEKTSKQAKQAVNGYIDKSIYNIVTDKSVTNISSSFSSSNARENENSNTYVDQIKADHTFWEGTAMSLRVPIDAIEDMLQEFVNEKLALGETHKSYQDFRKNFFAWLRIAISKQQHNQQKNDTKTQDRYAKRRGVDSAARSAEDYTEAI